MSCPPHLGPRYVASSTHKTATNETQKTKRTHLAQCFQYRLVENEPRTIPLAIPPRPGSRRPFAMRYSKPVMRPLALLLLFAAPALAAEKAAYDSNGRLIALD